MRLPPDEAAERFSGNLAHYRLQLVVPALFERAPSTGVLRLRRGATERTFHLKRGCLAFECSNEPKEHLAQVMADLHILDAAAAARAFEAAQALGAPLGAYLVDRGIVDRPRVTEALCHKAREAFFDCYDWQVGEIEFTPGEAQRRRGLELKLPLGGLHRDALARGREWSVFRDLFPGPNLTFEVYREWAAVWSTEEEGVILALAEEGASLAELLASSGGSPLSVARRILQLYRRGVMSPRPGRGKALGEAMDLTHLLDVARTFLSRGDFESAAAVAAQALERGPVPEAQALYREAEQRLGLSISDHLAALEGQLEFEPLPNPPPAQLTADELYLYSRLRSARSVRQVIRTAPMGELAAYRSVQRLLTAGLIRVVPVPGAGSNRTKTDPFGFQQLSNEILRA